MFPITGLWFIYNSNMQDMTLRLTLDQGVMEIRVPLMCTLVVWNDVVAVGPPTFSHNRAWGRAVVVAASNTSMRDPRSLTELLALRRTCWHQCSMCWSWPWWGAWAAWLGGTSPRWGVDPIYLRRHLSCEGGWLLPAVVRFRWWWWWWWAWSWGISWRLACGGGRNGGWGWQCQQLR